MISYPAIASTAAAVLAGAALAAGCTTNNYPAPHPAVTVTETVTRTVTRTAVKPEPGPTVTRVTGIPVACGAQLWKAWADRAPIAANMADVAPSVVPACMPYLSEIDGG